MNSLSSSNSSASRQHLLAVQDELHELADLLACLPELRRFADVLEEIIHPPPETDSDDPGRLHDRIGCALRALSTPQNHADDDSDHPVSNSELADLNSAMDAMIIVIRYRLIRTAALVGTL